MKALLAPVSVLIAIAAFCFIFALVFSTVSEETPWWQPLLILAAVTPLGALAIWRPRGGRGTYSEDAGR